jgi:hypothetical protein
MIDAWAKVTDGHTIAAQFGCHEDAWHTPSLHQLHQETLGSMGISAALHQDFQYVSVGVDRSPKPMFSPSNWNHDLINVPFVGRNWAIATDLGRYLRSESLTPYPEAFIRDDYTPFGQQILDIAQTA